jgi:ubiquinone/menaquinone biosynthesis C-methylase UbiE
MAQEKWEVVRLSAIAEEDEWHRVETVFGRQSFRRKAGEVLHPVREPPEMLGPLRRTLGEYNFAAQYQQAPSPRNTMDEASNCGPECHSAHSDPEIRRTAIATTISPVGDPPVEACLAQLLDHLGIAGAHFAGRSLADVQGFIAKHSERIASLTLVCPTVLNPHSLAPLDARLLVVTGDHGLGARRVQAVLPALPEATAVVLDDYAGLTWADLAADRGERIDTAMREFLQHRDPLPSAGLSEQQGETADISFRIRGSGPPLVLLPLDLSPGQWEPLIPTLSARHCTIALGGPLFGSVASLEERGRSGYMAVVRGLLDALAIRPGESVLEVGCGSGVIVRELARRTAGANRLIGRDINAYLLREARALARRAGLLDHIDFGEGRAEALPLPDAAVDVALSSTVFEEGDAERMLAEIVRVTRPGGRIGIVVRAVDMPFWVNLPLDPALKAKVDAPNVIGGGVAPKGVADASLYRRLSAHGLTGLKCFPQLVSVVPGSERIERYQQQILAALTPAEAATWHLAVAAAERDGTFFIAQSYHCAVATKPS